jgi:hypothetical protein
MKKIILFVILLTSSAMAIMNISLDEPYEGLRSNSIIELAHDSTGIWIGSAGGASYRLDGDTAWTTFTGESGLHSSDVSALATSYYNGHTIVCIATLHNEYASGQTVPFGDGFSITTDYGQTWLPDSLTMPFHATYYGMLAYDIDMYQNDIYAACFYGGLLRSMNGGYSWDNLYLNSADSTDLTDSSYQSYTNRYFSVKFDTTLAPDTLSVWGGSAAGLIRYVFTDYGDDHKQASAYAVAHREADAESSLPGNHVVALAVHGRPGKVDDAFVVGDYAYLAHDTEGLIAVDISDPGNPVFADSINTNGKALAVYVDSATAYAYVANYDDVVIIDINDPSHLTTAGTIDPRGGRIVNLCVSGDRVYMANEIYGLQIFPAEPGSTDDDYIFASLGGISDVYVDGDYAYIAAGSNGLGIVDISNLDSLTLVGRYDVDTLDIAAKEVVVHDSVAYIADASLGLMAIDVSDPANPTLIDIMATPGTARGIAYNVNRIYLADESALQIFALAAPDAGDSLLYINGISTPGTAINIMTRDSAAYVADNYHGLQIIDIGDVDDLAIDGNFAPVCSTYIWAACRAGVGEDGQRYAVAYSTDYGGTWKAVVEEPAWDFAFIGDTVIVATDNGLYVSDNYVDWHVITQMEETDAQGETVLRYFPSGFYALESVGSSLWAGGADGTVYTDHLTFDETTTWDIFRSQINPDDHYAYPSPFSPLVSNRQGTTIHYKPPRDTKVTIKIYDFNLDLVSVVVDGVERDGGVEADNDVWDGRNDKGEVVANGIYFYNIKLDTGEDWWGKVAVVK